MPLDKRFAGTINEKEGERREVARLTVLDKNDKNTIYNLIFSERRTEERDLGSNAAMTIMDSMN